jgi:hypothetical protein
VTLTQILGNYSIQSSAAANTLAFCIFSSDDGTTWTRDAGPANNNNTGAINSALTHSAYIRVSISALLANPVDANTFIQFSDVRLLGVIAAEDVADGFYGDTLIRSLITYITTVGQFPFVSPGTIESGSDFTIDHLDASTRRTCLDLLTEITQYYTREWAVWEDALLDWKTPNLQQHQWLVSSADLVALDLDASTVNAARFFVVTYADAVSGLGNEQIATSIDRRNPYVLTGNGKAQIIPAGIPMTSSTALQLATKFLSEPGGGPVPASGQLKISGEKIVQNAQGNAVKAWEIRAGENITITDLPLADIFTQDGRGENLFHIISTEANASDGTVTLSLDSFGSRRMDVLMARIAAATKLLTG